LRKPSNHLGNVLSVISDIKTPVASGTVVSYYESVVISSQDYSPFGVTLSGRSWSEGYRYGFNGKEKDPEGMGGGGNTYDYGFRIYNANLAKFLSMDPLTSSYPWNSTYAFAENRVIDGIDLDGCEYVSINRHTIDGVTVQLNINKYIGNSSAPLAPPITETQTTHNTNPAGQVVQSTTFPTSMNGASVDSQIVMADVNGAGAATTQGRLSTVPAPAPLPVAQASDQRALANVLGPRNQEVQNVRITAYNQFNCGFISNPGPGGGAPAFAAALATEISQGNLSPTGLVTVLPGNVTRVMIITDGTPANVANAQAQVALLTNNPLYSSTSFAIVSDPVYMANLVAANPASNMNSVSIRLNPTADFTIFGTTLGAIPAANYVMPFTSNGTVDTQGMVNEPTLNVSGLQSTTGTPIE